MVRVTASSAAVTEGGSANFTVTSSQPLAQPLTVFYGVAGNAQLGNDYLLPNPIGQVVIPAGQTSVNVTLTAMADGVNEKGEKAKLVLTPNASYLLPKKAGKSATIKITNVP